jgi:murein L,D-transpeptidase YcbB/YkuD
MNVFAVSNMKIFLVFILIYPVSVIAQITASDLISEKITAVGETDSAHIRGHRILAADVISKFYKNRDFKPVWTDAAQIREVLEMTGDAWQHGLIAEDYFEHTLSSMLAEFTLSQDPDTVADFDILLTESLVRYASNRRFGKVMASSLDHDINFSRNYATDTPPEVTLQEVIDKNNIKQTIDKISSHGPWYNTLQKKLTALHNSNEQGGWPQVSGGKTLHPSDRDPRVNELRARLGLPTGSDEFDDELKSAVKAFQRENRLDADGVVGPATLRTMNITLEDRLDQVRASLERLRWLSSDSEVTADFIAVNIAGFRLYLVRDNEIEWTTKVMVGKSYRQTPIFRGEIQYLEFNPTWTVPPGIHRRDILPKVKRDINYLENSHMIVLDYQGNEIDAHSVDWNKYKRAAPYIFRQQPGPWNALGEVKFIFPNPHFVFLHDTNHRDMFVHPQRAFSSGCIRVQDPMGLAEKVLAGTQWDREAIESIREGKKTQRINLEDRLPVFLLYLTAAIGVDGEVEFLQDIYERDGRVIAALDAPVGIFLPE